MGKLQKLIGVAGVVVLSGSVWHTVLAADDNDKMILPEEVAISASQVVDIALQHVPGMVVETELEKESGQVVWEVEVLSLEKKMVELKIDGLTGQVLESN